jgi:hypothetical protein
MEELVWGERKKIKGRSTPITLKWLFLGWIFLHEKCTSIKYVTNTFAL